MPRPPRSNDVVRAPRPGEGSAIPISKRIVPQVDGTTNLEISIDLTQAPIPERRYHADTASVVVRDESVLITFGQVRLTGPTLRSLVIVSMMSDGARQFLVNCKTFLPTIDAFIDHNAIPRKSLQAVVEEPPHTVSVVANLVGAAQASKEASLDFYHLSPWSAQDLRQRSTMPVDPIVRIDLSTSLLSAVLHGMIEADSRFLQEA